MTTQGIVFDVKKYSIHDGPGIRTTVFLKGCPLKCWWCHNPESQNLEPDIVEKTGRRREFNTHYSDNREAIGKQVTVNEIIREIEKDTIFYDESGGGVTFSGGEPLMQAEFLFALLSECKERELHTVIDTSGYAPFDTLDRMIPDTDLFLYDIKLMDNDTHKKYTGVDGGVVLENLKRLVEKKAYVEIRVPVIPDITDTDENLDAMMDFLLSLNEIRNIGLLPYNRFGHEKYKRLNKKNKMMGIPTPSKQRMEEVKIKFNKRGFHARIGG